MRKHAQITLCGMVCIVLSTSLITLAAPPLQNPNLPTPTVFPVSDVDFTLTTVGGEPETLRYTYDDRDGFTFGETSVTSEYPRGMIFTLNPISANGEIASVTLTVHYARWTDRFIAEWDATRGTWVAHPWATGDRQAAWAPFEFEWQITDTSVSTTKTPPIAAVYSDPTRQWFRMESDLFVFYWTNFFTTAPEVLAENVAEAIAATHQRRVDGFGAAIRYKPTAVMYDSRESLAEIYPAGTTDDHIGGYADRKLGMSVQIMFRRRTTADMIEWVTQICTHELVHLYQYDIVGGLKGPNWWVEGQAEWFATTPGLYDERLRNLAYLQDIPSLTTEVGGLYRTEADGRGDLAYDVGPSFINWLLVNYGGIDTHRQVVVQMIQGASVYDALEQITGESFLDLENKWRTYLGYKPLDLADIDPTAALAPVLEPLFEIGETIPFPEHVGWLIFYQEPTPTSMIGGQCCAHMDITVQAMGSRDGLDYYQIECMGQVGWVPRDSLVGTTTWYVSADSIVNLRECPSTSCALAGTANAGDPVNVITTQDDWHLIRLSNGRLAWIATFLTTDTAPGS